MGELIVLSDEFEKKLHPEVRKVFHDWNDDFQLQVQIAELNDDDLKYLSGNDRIRLNRILEIPSCLNKCVDIKDGDKFYDVYLGDIFLSKGVISQLRRDLLNIEFDIVPPLKKIYEGRVAKAKEEEIKRVEEEKRKAAKAEEEQRKREEEERQQAAKAKEEQRKREEAAEAERGKKEAQERWWAAYKAINIPANDVFKYLKPEEHEQFTDSIFGAVGAYLAKRESYILDSRADDYLLWINVINRRREEEERKNTAAVEAREFGDSLNEQIKKLEASLYVKKQSPTKYFAKDRRYIGQRFFALLSPDEKEDLFDMAQEMVKGIIDQLLSGDLCEFTSWKHTQYYHLLPTADYALEGIPCLRISFETEVVAEVKLWLEPKDKKFRGHPFRLPEIQKNNYRVRLQEPKFLGYKYIHFAASKLPSTFWQTIPLILLKWLLNGQTKPQGITISAASDNSSTYKIAKFKEEVLIPDSFAEYLKSIGSIDGIVAMGIITERVGGIIKSEGRELKVEEEVSPQKYRIQRKDTGKAKAFRLFDEGKRPSDREVKALNLTPKCCYKYYGEWKKLSGQ